MNQEARVYWNEYWKGQDKPQLVSAWQFGADPDYLAQLVIEGTKTATCSGYVFYELENEPLPTTEDYSIILNSVDQPVAIIKTVEVSLTPMNEVTEEFAIAEGEGDRTYQYWWDAHEKFFKDELNAIGRKFSEQMLLVCERFKVIDVNNGE
ncbi:ASCH domain-containing protein [Halobacillus naozhouensis]|uniref:ASCH domain-containing protein n=1 Tax=Halobacillus naozhouensis TaxID=554880 RepID=A0ABY8J208_9BACI|nr:ASCH domain-containing protein [Halobacillus naozhouensis]WFT76530.1 ASCH domain-containing protein [Halobacillus naozhouensis]